MSLNSGRHSVLKTMNQKSILMVLSRKNMSLSSLSKLTGLSISGTTTLMKEMQGKEIIEQLDTFQVGLVGRPALEWKICKKAGCIMAVQVDRPLNVKLFELSGLDL